LCQGFTEKTVKAALIEAGMLAPAKDGRPAQLVRLPDLGTTRVYVMKSGASDE
jgi:hypothetical protein